MLFVKASCAGDQIPLQDSQAHCARQRRAPARQADDDVTRRNDVAMTPAIFTMDAACTGSSLILRACSHLALNCVTDVSKGV
jgi:hypothetical protein